MRLYLFHEHAIAASAQFAREAPVFTEEDFTLSRPGTYRNNGRKPRTKRDRRNNPVRRDKMSYNRI